MTSTRRWWPSRPGKARDRGGLAVRHLAPGRTRPGWRCSTCPPRGWKARTARWRPAATPATARRASCRSSTGCSPTRRAGAGRGPGPGGEHRRPGRVHPDSQGAAGQVRAGEDGLGRRPGHDHQRPHQGAEPAGGRRGTSAGPLRVDHRAARPRHQKAHGRGRPLRPSLFDEQDLAEITSPDFPGERLIACRNPVLAGQRARTREDLLQATGKLLAPSSPGCRPGGWPASPRSASRQARWPASTRWANTSTSPSPTTA